VATNCSVALSTAQEETVSTVFCGSNATSSSGSSSYYAGLSTSDDDKCFLADYRGPKHSAWVAGFIIAVVFSFLASVGINLQKRALKQNETTAFEQNKEPLPAYKLPLWAVGFVLIILGSMLDFVAFGLAPQSLLAPLAALTLVWNMVRLAGSRFEVASIQRLTTGLSWTGDRSSRRASTRRSSPGRTSSRRLLSLLAPRSQSPSPRTRRRPTISTCCCVSTMTH
jgi:hypothetical protein